jgi:hypothetical protein
MNAFQTRHVCAFVLNTTFRCWMRQASRQRTREIAGRWEALAVGATVAGLDKHALSGMLSSAASVKKRTHLPCSLGRSHDGGDGSLPSTADSSFKGRKESKFLSGMAALRVGLNPRRRLSSAKQAETLGEDTRLELSSSTVLSFDNMSRSMVSDYMRPSSRGTSTLSPRPRHWSLQRRPGAHGPSHLLAQVSSSRPRLEPLMPSENLWAASLFRGLFEKVRVAAPVTSSRGTRAW